MFMLGLADNMADRLSVRVDPGFTHSRELLLLLRSSLPLCFPGLPGDIRGNLHLGCQMSDETTEGRTHLFHLSCRLTSSRFVTRLTSLKRGRNFLLPMDSCLLASTDETWLNESE